MVSGFGTRVILISHHELITVLSFFFLKKNLRKFLEVCLYVTILVPFDYINMSNSSVSGLFQGWFLLRFILSCGWFMISLYMCVPFDLFLKIRQFGNHNMLILEMRCPTHHRLFCGLL